MRIALLADIHANREALDAVLEAVDGCAVDRLVVLGDLVGYGPDPEYVVERIANLISRGAICVKGNHDAAVCAGPGGMSENARYVMDWTRTRLSSVHAQFLDTLPLSVDRGEALFVHASAETPGRWHYISGTAAAERCLRATAVRNVFCGHTHVPAIFYALPDRMPVGFTPQDGVAAPLSTVRRHVVVVGAVGQPRDGNPAACFALLDEAARMVTMVRIPYDHETTARKIGAAGLPPWLGMRLKIGR